MGNLGAVAQHGDCVTQCKHFIHAMRDVQDGAAVGLEPANDALEVHRLTHRERRSRLVKGDDAGVTQQGFADLDHLPLAQRETLQRRIRIYVLAQVGQHRPGALAQLALGNETAPTWQLPEQQVLRY